MPAIQEPNNLGDLLKYEAPNLYSRDVATVASGQNLVLGTVVGRETATAKLKALDPVATDGTEIAAGVLAADVDATLIDRDDALLIARHAIVARFDRDDALLIARHAIVARFDRDDALLIARHAIVARSALIWPAGITPTEQAAAITQLETRGVLVRTSA